MLPYLQEKPFFISEDDLLKDLNLIISIAGFNETNQISITSVTGNDDWHCSIGKIKDLEYPEKFYSTINKSLKDSYMHELIGKFPTFYRWRVLQLPGRTNYSIHSDQVGNKINKRIHIPIVTNPEAYLMFFDEVEKPQMFHLEVGKAYEVNTTGLHSAINFSKENRYHLVGVRNENSDNRTH